MSKCVKDYTVIYSQPSIEALENLMSEFFKTFGLVETINDMFYYGVFCKIQNYANFDFNEIEERTFEVPSILLNYQSTDEERFNYVKMIIKQIMHKEIRKPEWMTYVELNDCCNEYGQAPSTFLYIDVKDSKYEALKQSLLKFLYSPNLLITMLES